MPVLQSVFLSFVMSNQRIKTPCVGLCSTVYGDLVCRGCKRFHHEVIHWNGYSEEEKHAVWLRLEVLLVQVMAYFSSVSAEFSRPPVLPMCLGS